MEESAGGCHQKGLWKQAKWMDSTEGGLRQASSQDASISLANIIDAIRAIKPVPSWISAD